MNNWGKHHIDHDNGPHARNNCGYVCMYVCTCIYVSLTSICRTLVPEICVHPRMLSILTCSMFTCVIYNCMHSLCEQQGWIELLIVCREDNRWRHVGECADTWYEQIQHTERAKLLLPGSLPAHLCESRNHPRWNGLTVLLFCDVHIDNASTLKLLQCLHVICWHIEPYRLAVRRHHCLLCSYCHNKISSGSPPVFHECTS